MKKKTVKNNNKCIEMSLVFKKSDKQFYLFKVK